MRKIVLGLVATAAIAAPLALAAAPPPANVAVNDGVGHVDKGDVQTALHWNNADFDKNVACAQVTHRGGTQVDGQPGPRRWLCAAVGEPEPDQPVTSRSASPRPTPTLSSNGKQITGWDLNGFGYEYVSGQRVGAPYVGYCPAGESFDGFLPNVFTTDVTDGGLRVNGHDLPNTPVVVPTV